MTKYEKLTADLIAAYKYAYEKSKDTPETGAMNFDAAGLWLPRWNEEKTRAAARAAEWSAVKYDKFLGKPGFYTFGAACGIADRKSKFAEAATEFLKRCGYDSFCYCASD